MNVLLRILIPLVMLLACMPVRANSPQTWPVSPSRLSLTTPYGRLHIDTNEYIYESRLLIDDAEVQPHVRGILNITYAFKRPDALIALVSINDGNGDCPISYRWVILKKSGYTLSPSFGSCSERIAVTAKGHKLTMRTPSAMKPDKIDVYTYDGKEIRRTTTSN